MEFLNIANVTPNNELEKILSLYHTLSLEAIETLASDLISWKESEPEQSTIYWDKSPVLDERLQVCSFLLCLLPLLPAFLIYALLDYFRLYILPCTSCNDVYTQEIRASTSSVIV